VLENDGRQRFTVRTLVDKVARVADARAADLDGDGDLDVSVAGFGYDDGETSWLENTGASRCTSCSGCRAASTPCRRTWTATAGRTW
jgi:hypothetical protein